MKDSNAMDVDVLSTKQREEAMRKGACFGCGEIGHISCNCPKKNKGYGQGGQGGNTGQAGQSGTAERPGTRERTFSLIFEPLLLGYQPMSLRNS
jgi:hypothetical protein